MLNKVFYVFLLLLVPAFLTFGCSAGGVPSSSGTVNVGKLEREETLQYRTCTQDTDCIYAQNGCCDCANGGESIAIKITKLIEFEALFACENIVCTELSAVPACDQQGTAKCESGICEFVKTASEPSVSSNQ